MPNTDAGAFFDHFYAADAISVEQDAGILVGSRKIRAVYDDLVKGYAAKIESVRTYVKGNAGWDWTDYHVTPLDPKQSPLRSSYSTSGPKSTESGCVRATLRSEAAYAVASSRRFHK